ncbi:4-hydroxy-tetrahydrodipicolinate reductase [Porphyromonas sp.]|uniref:4-hydroxy-tetrahydrodipicolinate reductase n=1 Tax=Porphyromonas sp. TaxID=1924944 RepID=UPI0026DC9E65|nr:4-hydroxy-tetrahydrodipicolinate reductase [Porphyromonas sp.]MDO4770809.1 4-hydroxy-tetrahydrodipicolinate reductase [Porphyromonas sp.]
MKIALIGYGKMGHAIEKIATGRGHSIVSIIDQNNPQDLTSEAFLSADVVIEFTTPDTAVEHYIHCFKHHLPVVSGTTGWLSRRDMVENSRKEHEGAFFYASNFSVGVYIFDLVSRKLAQLMNPYDYEVRMQEVHHIHKKDHPSGTALSLAEGVLEGLDRKKRLVPFLEGEHRNIPADALGIECFREGEVPGIHRITYESDVDTISIEHSAKGREGFALGAVLAAEFIRERKGAFGMKDMMTAQSC